MNEYIIGIDGGGTKTLGVLFDKEGYEIKRITKGFGNFSVSVEETEQHIIETIDALIIGVEEELVQIVMGIAGYTNYEHKDTFKAHLSSKYHTDIHMVTDAEIALYSVKKDLDQDVIMVLGGTGSVVIAGNDKGIRFIGGFGHLLGDEGSGYHLAVTALKNIIRQYEEGKRITELSERILEEINAKDYSQIKNFVYNNNKSDIAKLSLFIATFAEQNNKEAVKLFVDEGVHLAEQTIRAINTLEHNNEILIGIKGGFLLEAPYVKETLIQELTRNKIKYILDDHPLEPVYGTYYLALRHLKKR